MAGRDLAGGRWHLERWEECLSLKRLSHVEATKVRVSGGPPPAIHSSPHESCTSPLWRSLDSLTRCLHGRSYLGRRLATHFTGNMMCDLMSYEHIVTRETKRVYASVVHTKQEIACVPCATCHEGKIMKPCSVALPRLRPRQRPTT